MISSHDNLTIDGITKTFREWGAEHRINYNTIVTRYRRGHRGRSLLSGNKTTAHKPGNDHKWKKEPACSNVKEW